MANPRRYNGPKSVLYAAASVAAALLVFLGAAAIFSIRVRTILYLYGMAAVDLLALSVSILSLVAGYETDQSIKENVKTATTRYVGPFPKHIDEICSLIDSIAPGGTLSVLIDVADYGSFYSPDRHVRLHKSIKNAIDRGVSIDYLTIENPTIFTQNSRFFGKPIRAMDIATKKSFKIILDRWIDFLCEDEDTRRLFSSVAHSNNKDLEVLCLDTLHARGLNVDHDLVRLIVSGLDSRDRLSRRRRYQELSDKIINDDVDGETTLRVLMRIREKQFEEEFRECNYDGYWRIKGNGLEKPPVFLWLKDKGYNAEAVFFFNMPGSASDIEQGAAFRTRDTRLTEMLGTIFEQKKRDALTQPPAVSD